MPTDASASATTAKSPSSSALKRCDVSVSSSTSLHRPDVLDRLLRIDARDHAGGGLGERHRRHGRPHHERQAAPVALARVLVDGRGGRLGQLALLHVADDADDSFMTVLDCERQRDAPSDRDRRRPTAASRRQRLTSITSTSLSATSRPRRSGCCIARR